MADNLQALYKQIQQLQKEVQSLGGEGFKDINAAIKAMGGGLDGSRKVLQSLQKDADDLKNIFGGISTTLKNVVNDLKGVRNLNKESLSSFGKIEGLTRKISEHKKGENVLTIKQLKDTSRKIALEVENLGILQKELEAKKRSGKASDDEISALNEINESLKKKTGYLSDINEQTAKEVQAEKDLQKTIGITGKIFDGIAGSLKKIGIESEHFDDIKKNIREAAKEGGKWKALSAGMSGIFKGIGDSLSDPVTKLALVGKAVKSIFGFIKNAFLDFDKKAVDISRNFGATPKAGRELAHEFRQISASSNNLLSTTGNLSEAFSGLNAVAGTFANFGQASVETYNNLTKGLHLSEGAAQGIYKFSVLQGKEFDKFTNELSGQLALRREQSGVALSDKAIYESITQLSAQQRLNIKGGTQGLIDSVIEAKKLGAEFSDLNSAANSLLQFENSIGAELEAELLTGRNLNLERARAAALNGDQVTLAKELKAQLGSFEEFRKMNVIQQESLAKAFGMSADQVAGMLEKQEMLNAANKAGFKDVESIAKAYGEAADKEAFLAQIGDERLKAQASNLTFQEKINALTEKFKDLFIQKLEPMFTKFLGKFDEFIKGGGIEKIVETAKNIGSVFLSIGKVLTGPIGKVLGLLAGLGALKMLVGGLPVRIVGQGPMGGAGGGGGLMGSLFNQGTVTSKSGQTYAANSPQGRMIRNMSGQKPVGRGLTGMGAGMLGMGAMMAGQAIGGQAGGVLSSAGSMAAMGAIAGPIGAAIGGVVGLAMGLNDISKEKQRLKKEQEFTESLQPKTAAQRRAARIYGNMAETDAEMARYSAISGAGGNGGVEETNSLLKTISGQLSEQREIVMSGNKVGTAVATGNYQQG